MRNPNLRSWTTVIAFVLLSGSLCAQVPPILVGPGPSPSFPTPGEYRGEFWKFNDPRDRPGSLLWNEKEIAYNRALLRIRIQAFRLIPHFEPHHTNTVALLKQIVEHTRGMEKQYVAIASNETPLNVSLQLDPLLRQLEWIGDALKILNRMFNEPSTTINMEGVIKFIENLEHDVKLKVPLTVLKAKIITRRAGREVSGFIVNYYWSPPDDFYEAVQKHSLIRRFAIKGTFGSSSPTEDLLLPCGVYSASAKSKTEIAEDQDLVLELPSVGTEVEATLDLILKERNP